MQADWELSQTLTADGQGIRCAAVLPGTNADSYRLIVGNQGGSLIEFAVPSGSLNTVVPLFQHDHAVTAILSGKKGDVYVTACKDGMVRLFDAVTHTVTAVLKGHEKAVTSLAWADMKERWLVTGSWDGTARVWNVETAQLIATLPDHENSVCVAGILQPEPQGDSDVLTIATGSAGMAQGNSVVGHSTRLWNVNVATGETVLRHTVSNDHDGPIRDIVALETTTSRMLATCSNDGTVKIRDAATGKTASTVVFVQNAVEHPPMLLSVVAGDNYLAAGAEDGHVVVWDMAEDGATTVAGEPHILRHAECIWNVVALPEGDLATCCQDGNLRIFTRATERMASTEDRNQFAADVETALKKTQNGPSAEEVAKLHPWELNAQKRGTSEGQVHLFQKNGIAIAAQWSSASQTWIEVGEVTGQADTGTIDGVKYDHVLPIEVDQTGGGVATLQIGYNNGENPFAAAQRFIDAHMLPQHHLSEIADYITQRVGKHQPALLEQQHHACAGTPIVSYVYLPAKMYKGFELADKAAATTLEKMKNKIQEFGIDDAAALTQIGSLMETLATSNRYHASTVDDAELLALSNLLQNLSDSQSFPALDLARLTALHPHAASSDRTVYWEGVLQRAVTLCQSETAQLEGPAAVAVPMLSLRLFANMLKGGPGSREAVVTEMDSILDCAEKHVKSTNKTIRLSVATLLYNICYYLHQQKSGESDIFAPKIVPLFNEIISFKKYESEALFRTMVALGTLVMASPVAKDAANALLLASKVEPAASPQGEHARVVAKEIYSLLA
jgi:phospholipase A-2-activating protein